MKSQTLEGFQFKHLIERILACLEIQRRCTERRQTITDGDAVNDKVTKEKRIVIVGGYDFSVTYSHPLKAGKEKKRVGQWEAKSEKCLPTNISQG